MGQPSAPIEFGYQGFLRFMVATMGPDAKRWVQVGVALLLTVLTTCVGDTGAGEPHAPCFNCEIYNLMQHDQAFHDRQLNSQCQYPCECKRQDRGCKAGVNMVKDGCNCCYMCARQQGDMCDYKDKCDEEKGLYCDFKLSGGIGGLCRAKNAKPCEVEGKIYKDGEEFKPDCRRLCTCQNGQYACSSLCPQEDHRPSSVHCKEPRLINITGKCCREWTCPVQQVHKEFQPQDPSTELPQTPKCNKETTAWSACSLSCGMGVSVRVTNDNEDCQPVQQRRLCLVRPCELNDKHLRGRHCKNTWRAERLMKLTYEGCTSVKGFRPKYCSTCKRDRCCSPDATKTISVEFECEDNKVMLYDFMWVKSCSCTSDCQ